MMDVHIVPSMERISSTDQHFHLASTQKIVPESSFLEWPVTAQTGLFQEVDYKPKQVIKYSTVLMEYWC